MAAVGTAVTAALAIIYCCDPPKQAIRLGLFHQLTGLHCLGGTPRAIHQLCTERQRGAGVESIGRLLLPLIAMQFEHAFGVQRQQTTPGESCGARQLAWFAACDRRVPFATFPYPVYSALAPH
jgi:hypothetical protein